MATYREIVGKKIKKVSSDPSSGTEGEMWYNSTTGTLRGLGILKAWVSASPQFNAREGSSASFGTQTAGITSGGNIGGAVTNLTEEYNGTGWTLGGNLNTTRYTYGGAGTQTAGLIGGGYLGPPGNTADSEEYNGTAWTEGENINTARRAFSVCGTQTAGLLITGYSTTTVTNTEEYNGSSWSEVTDIPTGITSGGAIGPQTAALQIAGTPPGSTSFAYDGTNWTAGPSLNSARSQGGYAGATQNAALAISGELIPGPKTVNVEEYDGTSWTETVNVATARNPGASSPTGTTTAAFFAGGASGTRDMEEYNNSTTAYTAGAWATGGTIPEAKRDGAGQGVIGTVTSGLAFGGEPISTNTFEYDGTSWAPGGAMSNGRRYGGGFGPGTAAGCAGGNTSAGDAYSTHYETYNGTSWTTSPYSLSNSRRSNGGAGTTTAGLTFGGQVPPNPTYTTTTEEFDGEAWNTGGAMPVAKQSMGSGGTQTAALSAGGNIGPYPSYTDVTTSEEYNGTAWTGAGTLVEKKLIGGSSGTQTAFMYATGKYQISPEVQSVRCQLYDGTAWATAPNVSTSMAGIRGSGGPSDAAFWGGGYIAPGASSGVTEEFTAETSSVNIEDFTTS